MDRQEATHVARTLRARGITREWTITISETGAGTQAGPSGKYRVVISTPSGEQAMALYQVRMLTKPVEVAS